jgi:hypothetical protein
MLVVERAPEKKALFARAQAPRAGQKRLSENYFASQQRVIGQTTEEDASRRQAGR